MEVQLRESTLEIPTRKLLPGSVNPSVFPGGSHAFPYAAPSGAQAQGKNVPWRTVELENEYLLLVVLPDMGGRVARLYDKIAGRDIFMPVSAVNPEWQAGGMLTPGGLRFDFPASPSPASMDPVNWLTRRYPDGSASVLLGAVERVSFMNWKVELRLYPGLAYLEQIVELMNPTDGLHDFSCWSCADVPKLPGMRMCCPFDWRRTASGWAKWPMDGLVDSSEPCGIQSPYETSAKLPALNFFGAYWPQEDFGVAHAAMRKRAKGAMFRASAAGETIELCSGPFEPGQRQLKPHGMLSWKEYWFGVRGIGPFASASRNVAMAIERSTAGVVLKFSPNALFESCAVRLTHGGHTQECRVSLYPESPTAVEFNGVGVEETLSVDVFCQGSLLLSFGHGMAPMEETPDEAMLLSPRSRGAQGDGYPLSRGRALLRRRKFAEAAGCFAEMLRADPSDAIAQFYMAAAVKSFDPERARRLFYDVSQDAPTYDSSVLEAAALNIRLGNPFDNLTMLEDMAHPWGKFLLSVSKRLAGVADLALGDPGSLDEFFLAEQYLAGAGATPLTAFTGSREEQLACIASVYAELGLEEDCLSVLSLAANPGIKTALFKALFRRMKLAEALSMGVSGVFVNEPPLLSLLEACQDGTGKAAWLLGCFRYATGQEEEALESWLEAYGAGLRHTALLYCLGRAHALRGELENAEKYLQEDIELHNCANADSLALLCDLMKQSGDARLQLLPLLHDAASPAVSAQIAGALLDGGQPADALAFMEKARFDGRPSAQAPEALWNTAVGTLALNAARDGRADEARSLAARMFAYPAGMRGQGGAQSRAEFLWTLGRVYRLTGDAGKSRDAFLDGAREGAIPTAARDAEKMKWVNLCQEELRY